MTTLDDVERKMLEDLNSSEPLSLNIELKGVAASLIKHLSESQDITTEEVSTKAIVTGAYFLKERIAGSKLFLQREDSSVREVVFKE